MPTISKALQLHIYFSGDYFAANAQRRELQRKTRGAPTGTVEDTRMRDQLYAARSNVQTQAIWAQPFARALGNGAQPGVMRHFSSLLSGEANGMAWADARAGSIAHPCKADPSLGNVLRAGLWGMGAGLAPGVLIGVLAGVFVEIASGAVAMVTLGGLGAGVHVGLTVMLACSAAFSLGAGAVAIWAACQIIAARAANETESSREWENVSGFIALVPRVVVALVCEPALVTRLFAPVADNQAA